MIISLNAGLGIIFILCCSLVCCSSQTASAQAAGLYAGAAQVEITPKENGYSHYRGPSTGTHDPLYAKALVLRAGDQKLAIVVCDLLWIERELSSRARLLISQKSGIPYSNIIISATHTHTSPAYHANIRELTGSLRPPFDTEKDIEQDEYAVSLVKNIARAIEEAQNATTTVYIEAGSARAEGISFNRRFIMHSGEVRTNPGAGNPEAIRSAGPVDPEIGIVFIRRLSDNSPIAALTNYSLHADTFGGTAFSADYPAFLSRSLEEKFGKNFISIFAPGACGDINHVDVKGDKRLSSEDIGTKLGEIVIGEITNLKRIARPSLGGLTEYVYASCQEFSIKELDWAHDDEAAPIYNDSKFLERRRRLKIRSLERLRRTEAVPPTVANGQWTLPLEIQVFKIGNELAIVGLPGEVFVELGLAIKKSSPFKATLIMELTNSHIAYVPTRKAFTQGGYETINSRLAPGGGEMMVDSAVRLLNELFSNK